MMNISIGAAKVRLHWTKPRLATFASSRLRQLLKIGQPFKHNFV